MSHELTFTLRDVVALGFEARCVSPDGARYLWHSDSGLRVEYSTGRTTLITDPAQLPEGVWFPTPHGLQELERERESCPLQAP